MEQKVTRREFLKNALLATLGFAIITKRIYSRREETNSPRRNVITSWTNNDTSEVAESVLQEKIKQYVEDMREAGNISSDEETAWLVYDLTRKEKLVSINEDVPMQCASLVKPLVALAFFHKVSKGDLRYDDKSKIYLRAMIKRSSNNATNWIMSQIGGPEEVDRILSIDYGDIFQYTEVVEYIPAGGTTYKNKASASDYNRFLCALWDGTLPYSHEIKRLMSLSRSRLGDFPPGTTIYHKSGTTAQACGDIAILEVAEKQQRNAYTFIGIVERKQSADRYERWRRIRIDVIKGGSDIVYEFMKERYADTVGN